MDLFEAIEKRFSYRGVYQNAPLEREHLDKILFAAYRAPSGRNLQTARIIAVTESDLIRQIAQIVEKQDLKNVPAILVFLMEIGSVFAVEDCTAAVENAFLAVAALGYASCWIDGALRRDNRADRIAELLQVPSKFQVRVILPVGKAAKEAKGPEKKPMAERVFLNRFGNPI